MKKAVVYGFLILLVLISFAAYEYIRYSDSKLHLVMCDVGQGEAIFITTPTKGQVLIDGGPGKAVLECLTRNMPFWDRTIDLVILTHPHADHYSGLLDVVDRYSLKGFYTQDVKSDSEGFKLLEAKLANKNLSAKYLKKGDSFKDKSGTEFKVLWPMRSSLEESNHTSSYIDLNESSIIAILTYGNFSALLTGDAEESVIKGIDLGVKSVKVLKIPHHGSKSAVSRQRLSLLSPEVSLISVGEGNKFGHPSSEILELLNELGIKVLRTDVHGEIEIVSDGTDFNLNTKK